MPTADIPSTTATATRPGEVGARGRLRRGRLLLALTLLVLAALWSLASAVAAVAAWQASRISEEAPGRGPAPGGWEDQAIRHRLEAARALDPGNPRHAEQLALHLELLAGQCPPRSASELRLLEQAHALYLQSAARRPTWPLALTSVLRTDFKLGHFGDAFTRRYARAADLGRSEPVALRALVDLGLAAWPVLEPDGRHQVLDLLRHALVLDPRPVLERALSLRLGPLVEPLIGGDPALARLYADLRAANPASR